MGDLSYFVVVGGGVLVGGISGNESGGSRVHAVIFDEDYYVRLTVSEEKTGDILLLH